MNEWVNLKLKSRFVPSSLMSERAVREVRGGRAGQECGQHFDIGEMHRIMGLAASVLILPVV
jgi:hypothetical protein